MTEDPVDLITKGPADWFTMEPLEGAALDMLCEYKPANTVELAEWIMIASKNIVDENGLRVFYQMPPFVVWQIARMMQIAKLKVPK